VTASSDTILTERARKLAIAPAATSDSTTEEMLRFALGEEGFLAPLRSVREVVSLDSITRIPGLPFCFAGLTTFRGDIVPVVDVRGLLGQPEHRPDHAENLLIIESDGAPAAIWVDRMQGLVAVDTTLLTEDHAMTNAGFRGRTPDLCTVVDLAALVDIARLTESQNSNAKEA
jgi:purine-binding chemotaxis protein CheW